jgi:hypothetical protein
MMHRYVYLALACAATLAAVKMFDLDWPAAMAVGIFCGLLVPTGVR